MKKKFIKPINIWGMIIGVSAIVLGCLFCSQSYAFWGSLITFLLIVVLSAINFVVAHIRVKKYSNMRVDAEHKFLEKALFTAENTPKKMGKLLKETYTLSKLYLFAVIILSVVSAFFVGGLISKYPISVILAVIPVSTLSGLVSVVVPVKGRPYADGELKKSEFPLLWGLLKEVKKKAHVHKKIHLFPAQNYNAGITQSDKVLNILLGSYSVGILTRNELKQILLHEVAHFRNKDTRLSLKFNKLIYRYERCSGSIVGFMGAVLTKIPRMFLNFNWNMYYTSSSRPKEYGADSFVAKYGDKQEFINSLAKISAFGIFCSEPADKPCFTEEAPPKSFETDLIEEFKKALTKSEEKWRKMMDNELPAFIASHPTFAMRRKSVGVESYCLTNAETDEAFISEQKRFTALCDKLVYESLLPDYEDIYKNQYLKPLENVKIFEKKIEANEEFSVPEVLSVALSYEKLCDYENSQKLLNLVLESDPENAYALYYLGRIKLLFEDNEGLDMLYSAIELNDNFTYNALDLIENYCLKMGLVEEYEKYQKMQIELSQSHIDFSRETGVISPNDKLSCWDLDSEISTEIVEFMLENGRDIIDKVYAVKKTISEELYTYIIGIKPFEDATSERVNALMDRVFIHLDLRKEQFSLFNTLAFPKYEKYLKKVKNSIIFDSRRKK